MAPSTLKTTETAAGKTYTGIGSCGQLPDGTEFILFAQDRASLERVWNRLVLGKIDFSKVRKLAVCKGERLRKLTTQPA